MVERCMKRAETSGRSDDNAVTIKNRIQKFFDESVPVVDFYRQFGKVRTIDARGGIGEVYAATKQALMPQTMFMVGPKASGKTKVGEKLAERTNMSLINFNEFVLSNNLQNCDDETVVLSLIQRLGVETKPRVLLENFPQNVIQAKHFMRNCK